MQNQCPSARRGLAFYRFRHSTWLALRDIKIKPRIQQPYGCGHTLWLAHVWKARAFKARVAYKRWLENRFVLHDFAFGSGSPWPNAVREVQKVFPGTEIWLFSCSDAEGWEPGSHVWIGYSGQPYSTWLRDSDTVGGPGQFRFSTHKGMYRRGLEYVLSKGFRVPRHLRDPYSLDGQTRAWRSALGQAIAMGWARYTGNDNRHWEASWDNGCR